jgi:hypothetical protein
MITQVKDQKVTGEEVRTTCVLTSSPAQDLVTKRHYVAGQGSDINHAGLHWTESKSLAKKFPDKETAFKWLKDLRWGPDSDLMGHSGLGIVTEPI